VRDQNFLTVEQVAIRAGLSVASVWPAVRGRQVRSVLRKGRRLIKMRECDKWIEARRQQSLAKGRGSTLIKAPPVPVVPEVPA
jgi:hypothetical protein